MTVAEFRNEFDLLYNNILGEGAPGLDNYERSVYLTAAQEELVKQLYTGNLPGRESFEETERNRRALNELTKEYRTPTQINILNKGMVDESKFFNIPSDVMFFASETVILQSVDSCLNNKQVTVRPITHDEFRTSYSNPFRKPSKDRAWRVDISNQNGQPTVEIICFADIGEYRLRYIAYPKPIILSDLTTDPQIGGLNLTINGSTGVATSELNPYLHREIVNRAVELAVRDYRENTLKARIETNNRV